MKVALLILLLCSSAFARVGETYEQLRKRFDADPVQRKQRSANLEEITFKHGQISVEVVMVEGTVSRETYRNVSDYQANAIRNKQATNWETANHGHPGGTGWKSDTGLNASYIVFPYQSPPPGSSGPARSRAPERMLIVWDGRADKIEAAEREKEKKAEREAHLKEVEPF